MPSRRGYKDPKTSGKPLSYVLQEAESDVGATRNSMGDSPANEQENSASNFSGLVDLGWVMQTPPSLNTSQSSPLPWVSTMQSSLLPDTSGNNILPGIANVSYDLRSIFDGVPERLNIDPLLPSRYQYNEATSKSLLDEYYLHFHTGHPVLLPLHHGTKALLKGYPPYLISTMHCIGSQYVWRVLSEDYRKAISYMLTSQANGDGYLVQAMLIFTITLHAQDQQQQARQMLSSAIDLALKLGMHRTAFASNNNTGSQILEESWRRTWWELYVLDGMLAAFHQESSFKLNAVGSDVPLPCEEFDYSMCEITHRTCTADQLRNRVFIDDPLVVSSFAFRVEAVRILGQILAIGRGAYERDNEEFEAIEASLISWQLTLPGPKRGVSNREGNVDEMLFQAHMIHNASTIYLHQPESTMASPPFEANVPCTTSIRTNNRMNTQHVHSVKTIRAASKLLNLVTALGSLNDHSPFFICGVALGAMVELSACSMGFPGVRIDLAKEHIILATGALSLLSETWAVALPVVKEVKRVARFVFKIDAAENSLACDFDSNAQGIDLLNDLGWQDNDGFQ